MRRSTAVGRLGHCAAVSPGSRRRHAHPGHLALVQARFPHPSQTLLQLRFGLWAFPNQRVAEIGPDPQQAMLAVLQQQLDAGIDGDECASLRRQVADGIEAQIERLERKRAARLSALDTDNSGSQAL